MPPLRILLFLLPGALSAQEIDVTSGSTVFPGPYLGEVLRVIDGDTVELRVALWPGLVGIYGIRVAGIDAPETGRTGCAEEGAAGERASAFVSDWAEEGAVVALTDVEYGTYAGRVVAHVGRASDGADLATDLVDAGLAVEWEPGDDPVPWCAMFAGD